MLRFALPLWRQACIALVCTALLFAIWLPHILRAVVEELKRRRAENITAFNNEIKNFHNITASLRPSTTFRTTDAAFSWNAITLSKIVTATSPTITTRKPPLTTLTKDFATEVHYETPGTKILKPAATVSSPFRSNHTGTHFKGTVTSTTIGGSSTGTIGTTGTRRTIGTTGPIGTVATNGTSSTIGTFSTSEASGTISGTISTTGTSGTRGTIGTVSTGGTSRISGTQGTIGTVSTSESVGTVGTIGTTRTTAVTAATVEEAAAEETTPRPWSVNTEQAAVVEPSISMETTTSNGETTTVSMSALLVWLMNATLWKTTSFTLSAASTVANAVSTVALPLAVVSTLAPMTTLSPVSGYTMSDDTEYLPKSFHTPTASRLTIAKLALALNRINNIPLKWCTPETEERFNFNCHRAVRNVGDIRILQRTIMEVVSGRKDKVMFGAVGGSVTAGHDVKHHQLYVNRMASVFSRALDVPTVTEIGALSATGSEFFAYCLHKMFDMRRLDIVAIEFCINDDRFKDFMPGYQPDKGRPMEELVRQVLQYDNIQPLVVCFRQVKTLVEVGPDENIYDTECQSIEDTDFLPLAAYYALPLISWKKVFCRSDLRRNMSQFVAADGVHPTAMVHEQIGEFFSLLLKYAIEDLIGKLLSRYPSYAQPWNLPRPFTMETAPGLYPSTWIQLRPMCYINFERRDSGFEAKSLLKAVTHSANATLVGMSGPLNQGDVLEYYDITGANASATFAFQFDNSNRPELSLVMSLVYSTMSSCTRNSLLRITVSAKPAAFYAVTNRRQKVSRTVNSTQIVMPLRCYPEYHANMVDEIPFGSQFNYVNDLIQLHGNLILTIEKVEKYYPLSLQAIVAGWRRARESPPVF